MSNHTPRYILTCGLLATMIALSGCAKNTGDEIFDPYEKTNRGTHNFNKKVDRALLRPAGKAYGFVFTDQDSEMIDAFTTNMSMPRRIANNVLQLRFGQAAISTLRFAVNTTFGMGGLFDVATEAGMPNDDTDFGATLHRWGAGEGAYVELPFFGASNVRDSVGLFVDLAFDPIGAVTPTNLQGEKGVITLVELAGDRHQYSGIIDDVLYSNDDSYASQRLYFLQKRRFELNDRQISEDDLENPYETE